MRPKRRPLFLVLLDRNVSGWSVSHVTEHSASSWWGRGQSSISSSLLVASQAHSESRWMQGTVLHFISGQMFQPLPNPQGPAGGSSHRLTPRQAPVVTLSWVTGESSSFVPRGPFPHFGVVGWGGGEALTAVWLQGRVTTIQSDCQSQTPRSGAPVLKGPLCCISEIPSSACCRHIHVGHRREGERNQSCCIYMLCVKFQSPSVVSARSCILPEKSLPV